MLPEIDSLPVLDEQAAMEMVEGERELLVEIIELYRSSTAERIADMKCAIFEGCLEALAAAAHSIKGSSSNICAERLRALATRLEIDARQARTDGLAELCQCIDEEFQRFLSEVQLTA